MTEKTYSADALRVLLLQKWKEDDSTNDEHDHYAIEDDGVWLRVDEQMWRQLSNAERNAAAGCYDPRIKKGSRGDDDTVLVGDENGRPLLVLPATAAMVRQFDEDTGGAISECLPADEAEVDEVRDELSAATGRGAEARHDAAELILALAEGESQTRKQTPSHGVRRQRADLLTPLVQRAMQEASTGPAEVFNLMREWASEKPPLQPLRGVTESGIKWSNANDDEQELTLDALRKRVKRAANRR